MSWYVRTENGQPPEGFVGGNDWWHHHPNLCLSTVDARIIGVNTTDAGCTGIGGINTYMSNYYMVHLWVVDDLEYRNDVFAPTASLHQVHRRDPRHEQPRATAHRGGVPRRRRACPPHRRPPMPRPRSARSGCSTSGPAPPDPSPFPTDTCGSVEVGTDPPIRAFRSDP